MKDMTFAFLMLPASDRTKRSHRGKRSCSELTESKCYSCWFAALVRSRRCTTAPSKYLSRRSIYDQRAPNHLHPTNIPLPPCPLFRRRPPYHFQTKWPAQRTRPRSSACRLRRNPSRKSLRWRAHRPSPRYGYIRHHGARPHPRSPTSSQPSV